MSREQDDARLYKCFRKYEEIVKQVLQFDELTETMDDPRPARSSKPKRKNCSNNGSAAAAAAANGGASTQESFDRVIVQTITKFLHDLNTTTVDHNNNNNNNSQTSSDR